MTASSLTRCLAFGLCSWVGSWVISPPALAQGAAPSLTSQPQPHQQAQAADLPFTDVPPDHWAYQALFNLATTYGCLSGYPDQTFRGEAAVTRYEFAAGLDACLEAMTGLVEQQQSSQQQEIDALIESMQQSLEELRQIEANVETLEAQ